MRNLTPARASLSSKEEPCPLIPHRGFLIPCPSLLTPRTFFDINRQLNLEKKYGFI